MYKRQGESAASGSYTGTPIKVGGIGPITGAAATYGNAVKNAEELAVKEINAANGSDVFDWKFEDDEHDAEKSVNAYNSLKDWGMQVLAGPVTTTPTLAVAAESVNDNMFVMTPSASAPVSYTHLVKVHILRRAGKNFRIMKKSSCILLHLVLLYYSNTHALRCFFVPFLP